MNPKNAEAPNIGQGSEFGNQPPSLESQSGEIYSTPESNRLQNPPALTPLDQSTDDIMTKIDESHSSSSAGQLSVSDDVVNNVKDDGDLIEKEWVNKAKQIVENNRDDPYKQSEELNVVKADYMKQRYNRNIKIDK